MSDYNIIQFSIFIGFIYFSWVSFIFPYLSFYFYLLHYSVPLIVLFAYNSLLYCFKSIVLIVHGCLCCAFFDEFRLKFVLLFHNWIMFCIHALYLRILFVQISQFQVQNISRMCFCFIGAFFSIFIVFIAFDYCNEILVDIWLFLYIINNSFFGFHMHIWVMLSHLYSNKTKLFDNISKSIIFKKIIVLFW